MELKIRIILGILLVFPLSCSVDCASLLRHIRPIRDAEFPSILNTSASEQPINAISNDDVISTTSLTNSSLSSFSDKPDPQKVKHDVFKNSSSEKPTDDKPLDEDSVFLVRDKELDDKSLSGNEKPKAFGGKVNKSFKSEEISSNETNKDTSEDSTINKEQITKGTGRSLNIDIDKYISSEFHNKNNVYTLPTSPEIEKYLLPDSRESDDATKSPGRKTDAVDLSKNDYSLELTTPHSDFFDSKYRQVADGIKQNLEETDSNVKNTSEKYDDTSSSYDVSKLIDNYKNADSNTNVSLHANEFKSIDLQLDKNKGNKDVKSAKNVDYEYTYLQSRGVEEKPEDSNAPVMSNIADVKAINKSSDGEKLEANSEQLEVPLIKKPTTDRNELTENQSLPIVTIGLKTSLTTAPTKKPRLQFSLRNNTIETTAPESELKHRNTKHFSESPSLDPLYDTEKVTFTRPAFENAINVSKRGSTKFVDSSSDPDRTTPKFLDYDNKNFSIPPTATAWTLVSLKNVSVITTREPIIGTSKEQNVEENQLSLKNVSVIANPTRETFTEASKEQNVEENQLGLKNVSVIANPTREPITEVSKEQNVEENQLTLKNVSIIIDPTKETITEASKEQNVEENQLSLKNVSVIVNPARESITEASSEQNVEENQLIRVPLISPSTKKEITTQVTGVPEDNWTTDQSTKDHTVFDDLTTIQPRTTRPTTAEFYERITTTAEAPSTERSFGSGRPLAVTEESPVSTEIDKTTEDNLLTPTDDSLTSTEESLLRTTNEVTSIKGETTGDVENSTFGFKTTPGVDDFITTAEDTSDVTTARDDSTDAAPDILSTESAPYNQTQNGAIDATTSSSEVSYSTSSFEVPTEISPNVSDSETTQDLIINETTTLVPQSSTPIPNEENFKNVSSKTESENELYTTLKATIQNTTEDHEKENSTSSEEPLIQMLTTKSGKIYTSTSEQPDDDHENNSEIDVDYPVTNTDKNMTETNETDTVDIIEPPSNSTKAPPKAITLVPATTNSNDLTTEADNSTSDATSSTELLSHEEENDDNNSGMIAAIAISSVGGICLILLAGLLLIMRKRQKRVTYGQRCRPVSLDAYSLDNVSVYNSVRRKGGLRASKRSYGNPAFDDPVSISHQMNFQSLAKFAENAEAISAEFDEIPQVTARASEVPAGCETKNRYANVIPLPETRVFLKASDNDPYSDYINANYVTGPKNTRGYYIGCQGPMTSTVDDFWRMIWEQQCRVVLMLTNLYENGVEKCADYLPPSEVLDCHRLFGDFQITLKKREVKEKYIISSLQLKNMVSNSWREVTHLWYLGWPERGVPTESNSLIAFLIEARSHLKAASNNNSSDDKTSETCNMYISSAGGTAAEGGPMVVHCSPGTGRTGTVIACDIAIRDFELTRSVDVPKIVYRVRRDRASAVQTRDQYAFIYKVISLYATKLTGGALDSI